MRIFVTGSSGFIGFSVAQAFRKEGYEVFGLVRGEEKAKKLLQNEIEPIFGSVEDVEAHGSLLQTCDVIVHTAYDGTKEGIETEKKAVESLCKIAKTGQKSRSLIYTSGIWVYGSCPYLITENSPMNLPESKAWRLEIEHMLQAASSSTLQTLIIRPGCVYGLQGGSIPSFWYEYCRNNKKALYFDQGDYYTPMIHIDDLAQSYVHFVQKYSGPHCSLNITDGHFITGKEIALAISKIAGPSGDVISIPLQEGIKQFGEFAQSLAMNQKVSNQKAQDILGWKPKKLDFLFEVDRCYQAYFS